MPFSPASIRRFSLAVLAGALLLGGCALPGKNAPASLTPPREQLPALPPSLAAAAQGAISVAPVQQEETPEILVPLEIIRGGPQGNFLTGVKHAQFIRPLAVAARGNDLFVIDAGQDILFRYDRVLGQLQRVMSLRGVLAGEAADIYVAHDLSFYIADPLGAQVLQFDRAGRLLQTFKQGLNWPVAVNVDEASGRVLVADGVYDYMLIFNSTGQLLGSMGGRGADPGQFLNITAMAVGPDGVYVTSRFGQRAQVLGVDGNPRYALPQEGMIFPSAIAVDADNRIFVSDLGDNAIKVYEEGRLVARIGMTGAGLGQFRNITDLWFDEGLLYVADSLNGRIQVMRVMSAARGPGN